MTNRIDNRPRVQRVRPPPPKPLARPTEERAEVRRPASSDTQRASRAIAHGREVERTSCAPSSSPQPTSSTSPRAGGVREAQAKREAQTREAIDDIKGAARAVTDAKGDKDDARTAGLRATETVRDALVGKSPAEQKKILDAVGPELTTITKGLNTLSGDQTKQAVRNLAQAGEAVGRDNVDALAHPVAAGLNDLKAGHGDNLGELKDGLKDAITNGDGALFGAALATNAPSSVRGDLEGAVRDGIKDVREDFEGAQADVDQRNGELANIQQNFASSLSPEALEAGGDAFRREHAETYDKGAAAAAKQASVLEGAGLLSSRTTGDTRDEADKSLAEIHRVASHEVGQRAIGRALANEARGAGSFLSDASTAVARMPAGEDKDNARERLDGAVFQGASLAVNERLAERDPRGAAQIVRGAERVLSDDTLRAGISQMGTQLEGLPQGQELSLDQARSLASGVNGTVAALAREKAIADLGRAGVDITDDAIRAEVQDELRTNPRFQSLTVFGAAMSVAGLATRGAALANDPSLRGVVDLATAGTGSAEAGLGVARAFSNAARGSAGVATAASVLGRVNLAATVGLSAIDTVSAIRRGDTVGAGIAAAPIVGAGIGVAVGVAGGATLGAALTGPAAPIGAAIGAVVGLGASVLRNKLAESPEEKYEKATESFLRGALARDGMNADAAYRLRNVDGDAAGIGPFLPRFAERLGTSAPELLRSIAALPDDRRKEAVETILDADDDFEDWQKRSDRDPLGPTVRDLDERAARLLKHLRG